MRSPNTIIQVHINQQVGIDIDITDVKDFTLKPYSVHQGCAALPLQWFQCQAVVSKRLAIMLIKVKSECCVTIIWAGDVWEYHGLLDAAGVSRFTLRFF